MAEDQLLCQYGLQIPTFPSDFYSTGGYNIIVNIHDMSKGVMGNHGKGEEIFGAAKALIIQLQE